MFLLVLSPLFHDDRYFWEMAKAKLRPLIHLDWPTAPALLNGSWSRRILRINLLIETELIIATLHYCWNWLWPLVAVLVVLIPKMHWFSSFFPGAISSDKIWNRYQQNNCRLHYKTQLTYNGQETQEVRQHHYGTNTATVPWHPALIRRTAFGRGGQGRIFFWQLFSQ